MITVLSPAKTLDFESPRSTTLATTPAFLDDAGELMETLTGYDAAGIAGLMKLSATLSELTVRRNAAWNANGHRTGTSEAAPTDNAAVRQAILAFKGDVYKGLAAEELDEEALLFAQEHLRILSGLYGVLRPLDAMMPYRLEMGTRLSTAQGATLYRFWGERIAHHLADSLTGSDKSVLLNLASQEYFKAVDLSALGHPVITPVFKEQRSGGPRVIGVHAKKQRGRMARYIIDNRIDTPEPLKAYDLDGYFYSDELSTEREWVFLR